jgi:hypothetical protein
VGFSNDARSKQVSLPQSDFIYVSIRCSFVDINSILGNALSSIIATWLRINLNYTMSLKTRKSS